MPTPQQDISLTEADATTIEAFALKNGMETGTLLSMAAHALAERIRTTGGIFMPMHIGPVSSHCLTCPLGQQRQTPPDVPSLTKIVSGPW